MITCVISAGKFFSKEGKPFSALLHGRARALCIPWPSPMAFEAITFPGLWAGRQGQGRAGQGLCRQLCKAGLVPLYPSPGTLPPSIRPSIPHSLWVQGKSRHVASLWSRSQCTPAVFSLRMFPFEQLDSRSFHPGED